MLDTAPSPHLMNKEIKVRARLSPRFPPQAGARGEPSSGRVIVTCIPGISLWPGRRETGGGGAGLGVVEVPDGTLTPPTPPRKRKA